MNLEINEEVKTILIRKGITLNDAMPFLLGLYCGYEAGYIPENLKVKIFACGLLTLDYSKTSSARVVWKVPLFKGQVADPFDWLTEYMDMFKKVNPTRRGNKSYVEKRMKDLFTTHPDIRKEEVLEATKEYLSEISDPTYTLTSHKFISNENGQPLLDRIKTRRENVTQGGTATNPFRKIV